MLAVSATFIFHTFLTPLVFSKLSALGSNECDKIRKEYDVANIDSTRNTSKWVYMLQLCRLQTNALTASETKVGNGKHSIGRHPGIGIPKQTSTGYCGFYISEKDSSLKKTVSLIYIILWLLH